MVEGACIPLVAKERWPAINVHTLIVFTERNGVVFANFEVMPDRLAMKWMPETVWLHRIRGLPDIHSMGYGERVDALVIRPMTHTPEKWPAEYYRRRDCT